MLCNHAWDCATMLRKGCTVHEGSMWVPLQLKVPSTACFYSITAFGSAEVVSCGLQSHSLPGA